MPPTGAFGPVTDLESCLGSEGLALVDDEDDEFVDALTELLSASSGQDPAAMEAAMAQVCGFLESTGSPERFLDALGFPDV